MSTFQSDYEPVWEPNASRSGNFEDSVTFETTGATDVSTDPQGDSGPLASTIEVSGWTQDEMMLALQAANVVLFLIAVYLAWEGDQ